MNAAILQFQAWRRPRLHQSIVSAALAAFLGVTLFAAFGSIQSAHAAEWMDEWHDNDGSYIEIWKNDDGSLFVWGHEANGDQWSYTFDDNPNPDDSSESSPLTPENVKEMIKKLGGEMSEPEVAFWDNFLGSYLTGTGDGLIPVHNPSDLANTYDDGAGGGGSGIDGTGGDITEQLKNSGGGTPDDGDDEEKDDNGIPEEPKDGMFDDVMVGPPELINPNPMLDGGRAIESQKP